MNTHEGYSKITLDSNYMLKANGGHALFRWQENVDKPWESGTPTYVWGGSQKDKYYLYKPSEFHVASADQASKVVATVPGGNVWDLVYAKVADNDFARIRVGGSSNNGYLEIATADDANEPIYVRQYSGVFSTLKRTLTLLDGYGNSYFPGTIYKSIINSNGTVTNIPVSYSDHTHGTLHSDFTVTLDDTTTDSGWSMIEPTYRKKVTNSDGTTSTTGNFGFILKSVRGEANYPAWFANSHAAGVAFGGSDTKGILSVSYAAPLIKIAGGNGTAPVWWIGITGNNKTTYNLASFLTSHQSLNECYRWYGNAGKSNMNDIARIKASTGMTNLGAAGNTTDNPYNGSSESTSWHLYFNTCYSDGGAGSNAWVAQIVNKAGTNYWWVRSRYGGTVTNGTAWPSTWRHLVTSNVAGVGGSTTPVYVNSQGEVIACTAYSNASVNYANSAGNSDKLDGYHHTSFVKQDVRVYTISTSGTSPYNYIWLFRIGNKNRHSTLDVEVKCKFRGHNGNLSLRISTGDPAYGQNSNGNNQSSIKIYKQDSIAPGNFYYVKTLGDSSTGCDYYDVYYNSGAWNAGGYQLEAIGGSGTMYFEHKGTNTDTLPSGYQTIPFYPVNADTLDGWHKDNINWTGFICSNTSGLSSYWGKLWDVSVVAHQYDDLTITFLVSAMFSPSYHGIVVVGLRQNGANNGGAYNIAPYFKEVTGNIPSNALRLYYDNSTGACSLWGNVKSQYGTINVTVLKKSYRTACDSSSIGTLYSTYFSQAQTLPSSSYIELSYNYTYAKAVQLNTSRKIWGQSFNGTADITGNLSSVGNIYFLSNCAYNIGTTDCEAGHTFTRQVWARHLNASAAYTGDKNLFIGYNGTANTYFYAGTDTDGSGTNCTMTVTKNKVGIGLTTPGYALDVVNTIRARTDMVIGNYNSFGEHYLTGKAGRIYFGGNFHIDSIGRESTQNLYLNYYAQKSIVFERDKLIMTADGYIYPMTTSVRSAGMYGYYDSTKLGHIWSIGTAYRIKADGTNFEDFYGLSYFHTNWSNSSTNNDATKTEVSAYAGGHQVAWAQAGRVYASLGDYIWARNGFKKKDSSDSYMLLGGGGHKAISGLFTAFGNTDTGNKSTSITATIGGVAKSFVVNWANYAGCAKKMCFTGLGNDSFTVHQTQEEFCGRTGWATYLIGNHHDGSTYYHQVLALPFWGPPMYQRLEDGNAKSWQTFITTENYTSYCAKASHSHAYLPLSGGTMTGIITSSYKSGTYVASLTKSAITLTDSAGSYGGWICGPTHDGRITIATYQGGNNNIYLGYGERGRTDNSFANSIYWNGATNVLYTSRIHINRGDFGGLVIQRSNDADGASIQFRGNSNVYGYIGFNNAAKDKQLLRWSSNTNNVYTILDTSSTSVNNNGVITINSVNPISKLSEDESTVTDGTMFITSYASNNGFADTNAPNQPFKRRASCIADYIIAKTNTKYSTINHTHSNYSTTTHAHTFASITNKMVAGNEFNFVNSGFNTAVWINYLPADDRSKSAAIIGYNFGNGNKGRAWVQASKFITQEGAATECVLGNGELRNLEDEYAKHPVVIASGYITRTSIVQNTWTFQGKTVNTNISLADLTTYTVGSYQFAVKISINNQSAKTVNILGIHGNVRSIFDSTGSGEQYYYSNIYLSEYAPIWSVYAGAGTTSSVAASDVQNVACISVYGNDGSSGSRRDGLNTADPISEECMVKSIYITIIGYLT